ncbi:MAG: protein translocase subunit SecF [Candidatus Wildermuthbacteria bacterium]|nr:protein translocase subunit SecF [Candidatus Wildermuthbacteria bacterium]
MVNFLKYRRIYYTLSGALVLVSIFSIVFYGLNLGIDFTGGSALEIEFKKDRPSNQEIENKLADFNLKLASVQSTGERGMIIRMTDINEETHQQVLISLNQAGGGIEQKSFESIGPVVGKELTDKTKVFVILVLLAIVVFIAIAFRGASRPISSWKYGLVASLVAFFHDILIPLGVFSLLGKFYGVQVTIPIVVGLLTILGYSVHDTIVVFDRIRENISRGAALTFEEIVNKSLNQTMARSINTSFTTLLVLFAIFFIGGETLKYFSLILILGITTGTYSSIFIASPILVTMMKKPQRK